MKKIHLITTALAAILATVSADAKDGLYVGADAIGVHEQGTLRARGEISDNLLPSNKNASSDGFGAGLSVGYKKSFNSIFVAPELFYDYLNVSLADYYRAEVGSIGNKVSFRGRYGAKANVGYNFNEKFAGYLTLGYANVDTYAQQPTRNLSEARSKAAALYGFGATYSLTENVTLRAEYNRQDFNLRYTLTTDNQDNYPVTKVSLQVLKFGAVYSF